MASLSAGRAVPSRINTEGALGVAAGKVIFEGALVCALAGFATPGATALGLVVLGVAKALADNSAVGAADGDVSVEFRKGTFQFANSAAADAITNADIGKTCYIVDDQTVARLPAGNTRSPAGKVVEVDARGVWVEVGDDIRKIWVPLRATDLVAANAAIYGFASPVNGVITDIRSSLEGNALTIGDATLTGKINAVAITTGVITITQAGSAIGDKDQATPTAANVVAVGDRVNFTVGGANTNAAAFAELMVEISF